MEVVSWKVSCITVPDCKDETSHITASLYRCLFHQNVAVAVTELLYSYFIVCRAWFHICKVSWMDRCPRVLERGVSIKKLSPKKSPFQLASQLLFWLLSPSSDSNPLQDRFASLGMGAGQDYQIQIMFPRLIGSQAKVTWKNMVANLSFWKYMVHRFWPLGGFILKWKSVYATSANVWVGP